MAEHRNGHKVKYKLRYGRIFLFIVLPVLLIGTAVSAGFYFFGTSSRRQAQQMVKEEVNVTYGTPLTIDLFMTELAEPSMVSFASDVSAINMDDLASYQISIRCGDYKFKSVLNVIDDVAPYAETVQQKMYVNQVPDPNDCLSKLCDKSCVTVEYGEGADFSHEGAYQIPIKLTDAFGNVTIVECPFSIVDDHVGPIIDGTHDITIPVGETPFYRAGITVRDNFDPHPIFTIDTSEIKLDQVGTYPLKYIAVDECGNQTTVTVNVIVTEPEQEVEGEEVQGGNGIRYDRRSNTAYDNCTVADAYAAAQKVYNSICNSSMSDVQKGMRIFYWVNHNISFSLHGTTTVSWAAAACQAFGRRYSSCYGEWAACKALCDVAGIPNRRVVRVSGRHTWCLCYLNGGWYHCDATQYPGATHTFSYMMTDSEILKAVGHHKGFSTSGLPERCTISVQKYINVRNGTVRSGMPSPTRTPSPTPTPEPSPTESSESQETQDTGPITPTPDISPVDTVTPAPDTPTPDPDTPTPDPDTPTPEPQPDTPTPDPVHDDHGPEGGN